MKQINLVSRRAVTEDAQVLFRASQCGTFSGRKSEGQTFIIFGLLRFSPKNTLPQIHYISFI
jgi:hypothetical protein